MGTFNSGEKVDRLQYDFTDHGGGTGIIPEPKTKTVNRYFDSVRSMVKEVRGLKQQAELANKSADELSEEEMASLLESVDELTAKTSEFQERTMEALAILCGADRYDEDEHPDEYFQYGGEKTEDGSGFVIHGGSPTYEELLDLPMRVQQAFNQWMIGEIRPKATTPGSPR